MKLITARIKGVTKQIAKSGNPGVSIVCTHDDGSEWGKKIYQWIWWDGSTDGNLKIWAGLAKPDCDAGECRTIIGSHDLCGLEIDLIVDDSENMWKIEKVGLRDTLAIETTETTVPDDDIPF